MSMCGYVLCEHKCLWTQDVFFEAGDTVDCELTNMSSVIQTLVF